MDNRELRGGTQTELLIQTRTMPRHIRGFPDITDEMLVADYTKGYKERFINFIGGAFFAGLGLWPFLQPMEKITHDFIIGAPPMAFLFVMGVIHMINVFINSDRKFIFNRLEGTVTVRASIFNWRNRTITFPFRDIRFRFFGGRMVENMMIGLPQCKFWALHFMPTRDVDDQLSCLSFFAWYMDKNRPLPPLECLNTYREKDYLRRKAEGFPEPLYPSTIETPDEEWYIKRSKRRISKEKTHRPAYMKTMPLPPKKKQSNWKNRAIYTQRPFSCRWDNLIKEISDEQLVIDRTMGISGQIWKYVLSLVLLIVFVPKLFSSLDSLMDILFFVAAIPATAWAIFCLFDSFINPPRRFVFDRVKGTVTMHSSWFSWRKGTVTAPFDEVSFDFGPVIALNLRAEIPGSKVLGIGKKLTLTPVFYNWEDFKYISFFTWYMDRNRPLPPGSDLDAYREKDYLRRKAEGFPQPLYPSCIPTPDEGWYIPKGE